MSAVIQFYRFASCYSLVRPDGQLWSEHTVVIRLVDSLGFKRAIATATTDLHISCRPAVGLQLEDGLLPLTAADTTALLDFSNKHSTPELHLMLRIGFYTGARVGTITSLRREDLYRARPDPHVPGLHQLRVGPGTSVRTKF